MQWLYNNVDFIDIDEKQNSFMTHQIYNPYTENKTRIFRSQSSRRASIAAGGVAAILQYTAVHLISLPAAIIGGIVGAIFDKKK